MKKQINLNIDEYLYGRSKTKISWPLFLKFIKDEEEYFRLKANDKISEIPAKKSFSKFRDVSPIYKNYEKINVKLEKDTFIWL